MSSELNFFKFSMAHSKYTFARYEGCLARSCSNSEMVMSKGCIYYSSFLTHFKGSFFTNWTSRGCMEKCSIFFPTLNAFSREMA